tara:strand:- start:23685 stop:23861 length:177 start_codon:yes stop_codon:yes gene_type:complete
MTLVADQQKKDGKPIHTPCHVSLQLHLKSKMQLHRARGAPALFVVMVPRCVTSVPAMA